MRSLIGAVAAALFVFSTPSLALTPICDWQKSGPEREAETTNQRDLQRAQDASNAAMAAIDEYVQQERGRNPSGPDPRARIDAGVRAATLIVFAQRQPYPSRAALILQIVRSTDSRIATLSPAGKTLVAEIAIAKFVFPALVRLVQNYERSLAAYHCGLNLSNRLQNKWYTHGSDAVMVCQGGGGASLCDFSLANRLAAIINHFLATRSNIWVYDASISVAGYVNEFSVYRNEIREVIDTASRVMAVADAFRADLLAVDADMWTGHLATHYYRVWDNGQLKNLRTFAATAVADLQSPLQRVEAGLAFMETADDFTRRIVGDRVAWAVLQITDAALAAVPFIQTFRGNTFTNDRLGVELDIRPRPLASSTQNLLRTQYPQYQRAAALNLQEARNVARWLP